MTEKRSYLKGKSILAVDDERDVLDTLVEALEETRVDTAMDYAGAVEKLRTGTYDLAILDIMGVDGLTLLDRTVEKGIPTVMFTAHALSAETLLASIRKGAIYYLPKEKLAEVAETLEALLEAMEGGKPTWKILFDRLGEFFDEKFGPDWKEKDKAFWSEFSRTHLVGRGMQSRLMHDEKVLSRGI